MLVGTGPAPVQAQELIDRGIVHGWNLMVDPAFGNGRLIQADYQDHSMVRPGSDATEKRGYARKCQEEQGW